MCDIEITAGTERHPASSKEKPHMDTNRPGLAYAALTLISASGSGKAQPGVCGGPAMGDVVLIRYIL